VAGVTHHSFPTFFGAYMVIFLLAGMGNGSTYRMIPSIFAELGRKAADEDGARSTESLGARSTESLGARSTESLGAQSTTQTLLDYKRQAAAVIGIAGAVGAFGGFLIQVVLRQSSLHVSALVKAAQTPAAKVAVAQAHADWSVSALWVFFAAYIVLGATTWFCYLRKGFLAERVPSLAYASV
jgi:MFS transporter, NNP family, nitrate/nitrite transporter